MVERNAESRLQSKVESDSLTSPTPCARLNAIVPLPSSSSGPATAATRGSSSVMTQGSPGQLRYRAPLRSPSWLCGEFQL